jgi:signal transduction histidine kinase
VRLLSSLRSRLLLGAFFWTVGLLALSVFVSTLLFLRYNQWPRIIHGSSITHAPEFIFVTIVCILAGFLAVRSGLLPLTHLRTRLGSVHAGHDRRLEGTYPAEVQPLVNDLNALLDHQDQTVQRALAKAGDLAHGLKTPLAVLSQEAERAEAEGHTDLAATIGQQVDRMQRQIEYHLAHARAAASGATPGVRCSVLPAAEGLARTLQRLHVGRGLAIDVNVPSEHAIRGQREDLDEMLGNLLDNACKWARSRVIVSSLNHDSSIVITVDDDGPGIPETMWDAVLQRGVRADEAAPGSGFGLAIVRELAEVYRGSIALSRSPAGGLRASLQVPAADAPRAPREGA